MPRMIRNNSNKNNDHEAAEVEADPSKDEGEAKESMKKGPWSPAEDAILRDYVKKYGEGNWNSVQKISGLARCGKSCRLRWANHLRPNLRKGAFSEDEEQIIIELHAKLGNKWARMAAQLPGRTDNEIKNFWNTRMKRRQRAGLPLYPPEVQDKAAAYHLQQKQCLAQSHPSSFSFSSFLSSSYRQKLNERSFSSAANPLQNQPHDSACYTNPYPQFKFSNENSGSSNVGLNLSRVSAYGSSSWTLFNHSFAAHCTANDSPDYHSGSYNYGFDSSAAIAGSPYIESLPLLPGSNMEASSSQSPPGSTTPASSYSYASGVDGMMGASSMANGYYKVAPLSPQGNSGLLDALVVEAQSLSRNDKSKSENSTAARKLSNNKRKSMAAEEYAEEEDAVLVGLDMKNSGSGNTIHKTQRGDFSCSQFSTGKKLTTEYPLEELNSMDDDLFSLLNNLPSEMPLPDWYRKGESQSLGLETQRDASSEPTDQEFAWTLGTCWNNLPGIC